MISRRQFLGGSAVAIASTAMADDHAVSIIDPHFHVWDRGKLPIPWLHNAGPLMNRNYSPADYRDAIAGLNVRGSLYVEVNVDPHVQVDEAGMAIALSRQDSPRVLGAVVGGAPADSYFAGYVDWVQTRFPIRGMRVTLPPRPATDPKIVASLRRLGKLKLTVDLNAGGAQLLEMVDLIRACEDTLFVIDHCGNASPNWFDDFSQQSSIVRWRETMKQLAACPNAACKISGVAENGPPAKPESIRTVAQDCLDLFGPDRALFATNWPVCLKATTPAKWFAVINGLTRQASAEDRAKLFAQNAERWYRLS